MSSAQEKKVEDIFLWSPALITFRRIPPWNCRGLRTDYFPKRERVRTASCLIRVLSPEAHAEMLRQEPGGAHGPDRGHHPASGKNRVRHARCQRVHHRTCPTRSKSARLTQSREEQLQNAATPGGIEPPGRKHRARSHEELRSFPKTPSASGARPCNSGRNLSDGKDAGGRPGHAVRRPGGQGRATVAKAPPRNHRIPSRNRRRIPNRNRLRIRQSQPQNSQPQQAGNSQPQPQNSSSQQQDAKAQEEEAKRLEQELAEAEKRAEEVLEALQKMEQNANKNLDQLQALTLAERLRRVGEEEKGLGGQLTTNLADTIGLPPQDLPEKFQRLNTSLRQAPGRRP